MQNNVILNGAQRSEESPAYEGLRFFPGAPGLRMTSTKLSTEPQFSIWPFASLPPRTQSLEKEPNESVNSELEITDGKW